MSEDMINRYFGKEKGKLYAFASCKYCGTYISKHPAKSQKDIGAQTEVINDINQHIKSCASNPDCEINEMDKFINDTLGR